MLKLSRQYSKIANLPFCKNWRTPSPNIKLVKNAWFHIFAWSIQWKCFFHRLNVGSQILFFAVDWKVAEGTLLLRSAIVFAR
jgi:hypothetical protein